jgi:predicted nucleic-acid-binding protein
VIALDTNVLVRVIVDDEESPEQSQQADTSRLTAESLQAFSNA